MTILTYSSYSKNSEVKNSAFRFANSSEQSGLDTVTELLCANALLELLNLFCLPFLVLSSSTIFLYLEPPVRKPSTHQCTANGKYLYMLLSGFCVFEVFLNKIKLKICNFFSPKRRLEQTTWQGHFINCWQILRCTFCYQ